MEKIKLLILAAVMSSTVVLANRSLTVADAWMRLTPPVAKNTAGYLKLTNNSTTAVTIVKIETDIALKAEIHDMIMEDNRMGMEHVPELTIAPKETVEFRPGGKHLMLMGLKQPLKKGQQVDVTLKFSDESIQTIRFPVQKNKDSLNKEQSGHKGHH